MASPVPESVDPMSGVITLKDGRRVFDHAGEHAVGGNIAVPLEPGGKHKIVFGIRGDTRAPFCMAHLGDRWCFRPIHQHMGHWRHARRTYVSR